MLHPLVLLDGAIVAHHHFGVALSATDIGIAIAAISAAASAASAIASARGVSLSHRPFVVGTGGTGAIFADQGIGVVEVELRNHGPGVALNVRFRGRAVSHSTETYWSPPVAMLRPGEQAAESIPFDVPPNALEYELRKRSRMRKRSGKRNIRMRSSGVSRRSFQTFEE